ncbi:MAG: flavoprotein [Propionibacterium sp.]|nr:flavoprotein [Propionibacterium sp.]
MTAPVQLVALSGGVGVPSSTRMLTDQLTAATRAALEADGRTVEVFTVDLRDLAHQVVDMTLTRFPAPELAEVLDRLRAAAGVIAVTPTFNASYSGLFKSFFDVLDEGTLDGTPMLLGATGGTARHSLAVDYAMRPMMAYLRADVVATSVFAASEDFGAATTAPDEVPLANRARRAGRELADRILGAPARPADTAPTAEADAPQEPVADEATPSGRRPLAEEFTRFTPMEQLLGR